MHFLRLLSISPHLIKIKALLQITKINRAAIFSFLKTNDCTLATRNSTREKTNKKETFATVTLIKVNSLEPESRRPLICHHRFFKCRKLARLFWMSRRRRCCSAGAASHAPLAAAASVCCGHGNDPSGDHHQTGARTGVRLLAQNALQHKWRQRRSEFNELRWGNFAICCLIMPEDF